MTTAIAVLCSNNQPEAPSFTVEELYELQLRNGKLKTPTISFEQRNALKAKFLTRYDPYRHPTAAVRHSLFVMWQDWCSIINALFLAPSESLHWLTYRLWGHSARRITDVRAGRSRFAARQVQHKTVATEGSLARTIHDR